MGKDKKKKKKKKEKSEKREKKRKRSDKTCDCSKKRDRSEERDCDTERKAGNKAEGKLDKADRKHAKLMDAVRSGQHDKVQYRIFKGGLNLDHFDADGASAMHAAASAGFSSVVSLLAEHGANINLQDQQGYTALHLSVLGEHAAVAAVLLKIGAKRGVEDHHGVTAEGMGLEALLQEHEEQKKLEQAAREEQLREQLEEELREDACRVRNERERDWDTRLQEESEFERGYYGEEENPFEQSWRDDEATHDREGDDWFEEVNKQREVLGQGVNQGGQASAKRGSKRKQPTGGHSEYVASGSGERFAGFTPEQSQRQKHPPTAEERAAESAKNKQVAAEAAVATERARIARQEADEDGWKRLLAVKASSKAISGGGSAANGGSGGSGTVRFIDIPWPSGTDENILSMDMTMPAEKAKAQIKQAQLRWHPDKFMQKYGMILCEDGDSSAGGGSSSTGGDHGAGGGAKGELGLRDRVLVQLKHVVQCINAIREEFGT
jgi:hypothetical protein